MKSSLKEAPNDLPKKTSWRRGLKLASKVIFLLFLVATAVLAAQFAVGVLLVAIIGASQLSQPVWTAIYSALSYVLAMILIITIPNMLASHGKLGIKKMGREDLGLKGLPTWTDLGLAPVGFIVYIVLAAGLIWIFNLFPWFDAEQAQDVGFNLLVSGFDRVVAFLTLVVVAPIAEEIIFRGWLYAKVKYALLSRLSEKLATAIAILLVSILFGVLHMQWNVGVNVFAMSIILCLLREITGTTYAGILLHMIKNGLAFYLLYIAL
jgi:hypothetical protein